ncbi:hypothetical protein [Pseudoalteromonas maricaloris]|uniref:Uncharacterized protein n=1 Tax=Pseudoalteromonas maricaloris TaxID=184924 RepID=A0A8I2H9M7_9GAMM|nr:hypothetical protein [Pseudoalteromonas maricaloris]NLR23529.1 hypothetical protein [Pseudoalteromonas maricaloris]WOX29338.1 hypothetical protein R5H13_03445 [Pseudoalteromonas maricaloris]
MNIDDKYITEIGQLLLRCEDMLENEWESVSIVYDINEGHTSNSGFLYMRDGILPTCASIDGEPLLFRDKILGLREKIQDETGYGFIQLLIQMEKATGRIKIDFEFDDPNRWAIKPAKIKEMREILRPDFS